MRFINLTILDSNDVLSSWLLVLLIQTNRGLHRVPDRKAPSVVVMKKLYNLIDNNDYHNFR